MLTLVSDICREHLAHAVDGLAQRGRCGAIAPRVNRRGDGRICVARQNRGELLSGQASASALLGIKSHIL